MTGSAHDIERYADVDLYGVLHLTAQAGADLIDRAYRLRVHAIHPDHAGTPSTSAAALVNAAGAILREPETRARYDALCAAWRAKHQARAHTAEQQRVHALEEQLRAAHQDLAACRADLAASEASRRTLSAQVQRLVRHRCARRPRWGLWVSGGVGLIAGAVALSLVLGMTGSRQVRAAPAMLPLVVPAPAAAVASPGAEAEWSAVLHDLDATWEQDWPATINRLERFLERWPGYPAAEDKLYAALIADAEIHDQAGQVVAAAAELERAARLLPERGEAWARLAQLATIAAGEPPP